MKTLKQRLKQLNKNETISYLSGLNRPIDPAQVTKLAKSIDNMSLIRPIVTSRIKFIDGKERLYIIDGQHLFNALLRNNIPIEYVEIEVKNIEQLVEKIALLNASSKSWKLNDYILAWSAIKDDYKKLNKYFNIYDFELLVLAGILSELPINTANITKPIKNGSFKIVNEDKNVVILDNLTDVLKIIPRMARFENRYVCIEYVNFRKLIGNKTYNHTLFLQKLKENKEKFILVTHEQQKLVDMFKGLIK